MFCHWLVVKLELSPLQLYIFYESLFFYVLFYPFLSFVAVSKINSVQFEEEHGLTNQHGYFVCCLSILLSKGDEMTQ